MREAVPLGARPGGGGGGGDDGGASDDDGGEGPGLEEVRTKL